MTSPTIFLCEGYPLIPARSVAAAPQWRTLVLAVVAAVLSAPGHAQVAPILSYAPTTASAGADCASSGLTPLNLSASPSVIVASVANPGAVTSNGQTVLTCSVAGGAEANFTVFPINRVFDNGNAGANLNDQSVALGCTPGTQDVSAQLRCQEGRIPSLVKLYYCYNLTCQASGIPEFSASPAPLPAAGGTINLTADVGATVSALIQVTNVGTGNANLVVTPSQLSGSLSVAPTSAQSLPPQASVNFSIACRPTQIGTQTSTLNLATNDADEANNAYSVTCQGRAPVFAATPVAGSLSISTTQPASATTSIHVVNSGNAALTFNVVELDAPFSANPTSATIAPGNSTDVVLTCPAMSAGVFTDGAFRLTSNDPSRPSSTYDLTCNVSTAPVAVFRSVPAPPGPLGISVSTGATGNAVLDVFNDGQATLQITGATGLTPPLSVAPANVSISAGNSTPFTISCNSATAGSFAQSLHLAVAGQPAKDFDVNCQATNSAAPEINAIPAPGAFALSTSQNVAASRSIQIQNVGTATLTIALNSSPGGVFTVTPSSPFPISIAPGGSSAVTVGCLSAAAGSFSGNLVLGNNDSDENPAIYAVSCSVAAAAPEFNSNPPSPGPLSITTLRGANASTTFSISNSGNANLLITGVSGVVAPFSISPPTATLGGNQNQTFTLSCNASVAGFYSSTILVATNDSDEGSVPYQVSCRVNTLPPEFDSTPAGGAQITLSSLLGQSSTSSVTLRNLAPSSPSDLILGLSGLSAPLSVSKSTTTIGANGSDSVVVTCAPTVAGTVNQTLVIDTNDLDEDPVTFPVSCSGTQQVGAIYKANYLPGDTIFLGAVKGTAAETTFRITNTGFGANLNVSYSISPAGGVNSISIDQSSAVVIPAGAYKDARLTCTANNAGFTRVLLSVSSNAGSSLYGVFCNISDLPVTSTTKRVLATRLLRMRSDLMFASGFE